MSLPLLTGVLWGLAFQMDYLSLPMIVAALIWSGIWGERRDLPKVIGGVAIATLVGALADRWGYGQWTFPAWAAWKYRILETSPQTLSVSSYLSQVLLFAFPLGILAMIGRSMLG